MKIELDLYSAQPQHLGALIAAMMACGTLTANTLAGVVAPWSVPTAGLLAIASATPKTMDAEGLLKTVRQHASLFKVDELSTLIADLNAELYSRSAIKPDDNPAAGVTPQTAGDKFRNGPPIADIAGLHAAMDDTMHASTAVDVADIFKQSAVVSAVIPVMAKEAGAIDAVALDKKGLPWDVRIHASSKTINADGTWRQKRGVAPELVTTVEAQLRAVMAVPVPPKGGQIEQDDTREYHNDTPEAAEARVKVGIGPAPAKIIPPPPPTVVTPPAPPAASGTADPTTFPELVQFITAQKLAGKLAQPQLNAALLSIGVEGALPVLAARPDLIPALVAKLRLLAGG